MRILPKAALLAAALLAAFPAAARQVTDMAGRTVTVPDTIRSVYVMSHSLAIVTALAPELVAGLPFPFRRTPDAEPYLPARFAQLPLLDNNLERLKEVNPDVAVGWTTPAFVRDRVPQMDKIGLPIILVGVDRLEQYPETFRLLGRILDRAERGEMLAQAIERSMAATAAVTAFIPPEQKLRVYYAESVDGLTTQCDGSDRSDVIRRAGAVNAMHCVNPPGSADNMPVDLETLLSIDPDVIVTRFAQTAAAIRTDPRWSGLRAVREGRILAVPSLPFHWFDRPPSYMRALGAQWLLQELYPGRSSVDLAAVTRDFYALFFNITLTEEDLHKILMRP